MVQGISNFFISRLSHAQRQLLIDHIDGEVAIMGDSKTRRSLLKFGLLKPLPPNSPRPRYTALTVLGRHALSIILSQYAETLVRAGYLERPIDVLARLHQTGALSKPDTAMVSSQSDQMATLEEKGKKIP
jgi:hypothetical protein